MRQAILMFAIAMSPTPGNAYDDCEDAGKLGLMLGQIDKQCEKYAAAR